MTFARVPRGARREPMRAAAPPRHLRGRVTPPPLPPFLLLLLLLLWRSASTARATDEEEEEVPSERFGKGGDLGGSGSGPPPDCRVCAAHPAPPSACPAGRAPCGIEGVYSLRARRQCAAGEEAAAPEEEEAKSGVPGPTMPGSPGSAGGVMPSPTSRAPPARQVEVALDARAETGYGVVLDRTRQFLARIICHSGNERDCDRFPSAAPCPNRTLRDNGMCILASPADAAYGQTVSGHGDGANAAAEHPPAGVGAGSGAGYIVLAFTWEPPEWTSCQGLDRGVRANAAARSAQTADRDFLVPSRGLFRAKRSQAVPVRVVSKSGRSDFFVSLTVVADSIAHPEALKPSEVTRAVAARCGPLTQLVASVFHRDRPSRRRDNLRLKHDKDEEKARTLRYHIARQTDKAAWKRGRRSAAAREELMRTPALLAPGLEEVDENVTAMQRSLLRAVLLGYGARELRPAGTPLGTVFAADASYDDDRVRAGVLRQVRGKRSPRRGTAGRLAAAAALKKAKASGLLPAPSPPPNVTAEVQAGLLRHAGACLAATGLRVVDIGVVNPLHAAGDHELRALEPIPLGKVADRLWPSDEGVEESADHSEDAPYGYRSPETPVRWEGWGGMSGLDTGWARVNVVVGGADHPDDEEQRCDAVFQALGPCEGYSGAGAGGGARHLERPRPSSPWDTWTIRNASLADTREVAFHVAAVTWRHARGPFGRGSAAFALLATAAFTCVAWRTLKGSSEAVGRRVAWDRAAEDLANARARRANAVAAQKPMQPGNVNSLGPTRGGVVERVAPRRSMAAAPGLLDRDAAFYTARAGLSIK